SSGVVINTVTRFLTILIFECAVVMASLSCQSAAQMTKTVPASEQAQSAVTLPLPEPWLDSTRPELELSSVQQIVVRKLPNSSDDEFLFAALPNGDYDYSPQLYKDIPRTQYSINSFVVNFAGKTSARTATVQEWESASRIVTKSRMVSQRGADDYFGVIELRGNTYQ